MITRQEFRDLLDETYDPISLFGTEYLAGRAIEILEPDKFTEMYWSYVNSLEEVDAI